MDLILIIIYTKSETQIDLKTISKLCAINRNLRNIFILQFIEKKQKLLKQRQCLNIHFSKDCGLKPKKVMKLLEYNRSFRDIFL